MAPKSSAPVAVVASQPRRIPSVVKFLGTVATSIAFSSVLYTAAAQFIGQSFAGVSRRLDSPWQIIGLLGWRVVELGVSWYNGYTGTELASLTVLSQFPRLFLLVLFYRVPIGAGLGALAIELLTTVVPFSIIHRSEQILQRKSHLMNQDSSIKLYTTFLASAIYALAVYASLQTWLPTELVKHFYGLKDISAAHSINVGITTLLFLPIGYAASNFVFSPAADYASVLSARFDPKAATLGETIWWNLWAGFSPKTKIALSRTSVLLTICGLNAWLVTVVTVEGVHGQGALEWALVWDAATAAVGLVFWWVLNITL